jgi:hypothetical protein
MGMDNLYYSFSTLFSSQALTVLKSKAASDKKAA